MSCIKVPSESIFKRRLAVEFRRSVSLAVKSGLRLLELGRSLPVVKIKEGQDIVRKIERFIYEKRLQS